jgi:putative ABC transport system substrate-binding protein
MQRRDFLGVLGGAAAAWPLVARAQPPAMPVVGFLGGRSAKSDASLVAACLRGLAESGLVEGRQFKMEYRWADGQQSRLDTLVTDFLRQHIGVVIAADSASAIAAAHAITDAPIVFLSGGDPVKLGLVASFNRPGGFITGVTILGHSITVKRLELLRELVPDHSLIAVLYDTNNPSTAEEAAEVTAAAEKIGQAVRVFKISGVNEVAGAFVEMVKLQAGALLFGVGPLFTNNRQYLVDSAARHKIPAIYNLREFPVTGGLASYGADLRDSFFQIGRYAGRILKGEKPADLPVMQPTKFELVINLKTAKALGLTVSPTLLARADEVIE